MSTNTQINSTFREVQYMRQWWVWVIVIGVSVLGWFFFIGQIVLGQPLGNHPAPDWVVWLIWVVFGLGFPLLFLTCHLKVEVKEDHLGITYFPFLRKRMEYRDIARVEAVTYQPIWDYGGWGVRWNPRLGWAYNVSGNRGVQLVFHNGKRLLLGSQHAEELAEAIETRRREADISFSG